MLLLHLSDLHFGRKSRFAEMDLARLAKTFGEGIKSGVQSFRSESPVHVVVVSGDIVETGRRQEYEQAIRFLKHLGRELKVQSARFVFVPGNHDVNRIACERVALDQREEEFDDQELRRRIDLAKLKEYESFLSRFYGTDDLSGIRSTLVSGACLYEFPELSLSVAALNSCERESHRPSDHRGEIGMDQSRSVMDAWQDKNRRGYIKFLVLHHNPAGTVPENVEEWRKFLQEQADAGKIDQDILEIYQSDVVGFDGVRHLQAIVKDCSVQLVLHGHHHALDEKVWPWAANGHAHVLSAGSWGLAPDKLPENQPNSIRLVLFDLDNKQIEGRSLVYEPRRRVPGELEPGAFVPDPAEPKGYEQPLFLPPGFVVEQNATGEETGPADFPESISYYLNWLAEETAHLTLLGMGRSLQVELPIEEAYVPLKTTMTRSMEERAATRFHEGYAEYEENVDLGEVFRKVRQLKQRGVILLGEPGSGKTTGARQLAWRLASRGSRPEDLGLPAGMTPVFLRFRNLSRRALAKGGLRTFLEEETCCREAPDGLEAPGQELWNGRGGGLLWILDGLDEVVDPDARKKVSGWVKIAIKRRPDDWFLVTCRFQGYFREGVPLGPKFVEFHVRPLDNDQVERFVRDWFDAAYGKLLGPGGRAKARSEADAGELLDILARPAYQAGHIRELCTNPLLLTILCIVFHEERKLPTGRAELYAHCVRVLLEYWRRDLYESDLGTVLKAYDAEAAQAVLARVAWWMHQEHDRISAPLDMLAEEASKGLAEVAPSCGLGRDGRGFVERMRDESGILAMGGEGAGRCGFLHLSFQEYLAAEHAAREGLAKELASKAAESWWREVALLSLRRSRQFCEAFFHEMLEAGIAENHPDLAERCLQEALYFSPWPFVETLNRQRPEEARARRAHDARVAAILRLLRDRAEQVPELEEISRRLAESEDRDTRGFASEILIRRGVQPKAGLEEPGVIVDERTGIILVLIPNGEFEMGSNCGLDWEKPVHQVRISQGFLLGKYPVTNAQYGQFLEVAGDRARKPKYWDDRRFNQQEQPVVGVSWDEACAFCEWAGCRLPTEAEWEYACRAGTTTEYSFGDDPQLLGEYGWFGENSGSQTQPVGAKRPNLWGLHDMHGNVWEWCRDWHAGDYYANSPPDDPQGPSEGSSRVSRGGSWYFRAEGCRSAYRFMVVPESRYDYLGFRVARSPVWQDKQEQVK